MRKPLRELLIEDYPELADRDTYAALWQLAEQYMRMVEATYVGLVERLRLHRWSIVVANELAEMEIEHHHTVNRIHEEYAQRMRDMREQHQHDIEDARKRFGEKWQAKLERF